MPTFSDAEKAAMKERAREQREFKKLSGEEQVSRKIAEMADLYSIPFAPHNVSSPIGTMASAQATLSATIFSAQPWRRRASAIAASTPPASARPATRC